MTIQLEYRAESPCGGLAVTTTAQGLPLSVTIGDGHLRRPPEVLAGDLLRLCRRASLSAGADLRSRLAAAGVERGDLDLMGLPTTDDLARVELDDDRAARRWAGRSRGAA